MLFTFLTSAESILPIVIILLVGYFMARVGWIDDRIGGMLTKIILNVMLPCYMIWNLVSSFDEEKLATLCGGLLIPALSKSISYIAAILLSNIIKIRQEHKGVCRSVFFCSNTIFIGLPINLALFGSKSVPYVLLYYIVNTTMFWTLGVFQISCDGMSGQKTTLFSKATLKRIISPALMGALIGVALIMLKITLPKFVMDSLDYLGNPTTPLALIFIGLVLASVKLSEVKFDKEIVFMLFGRFIFAPALVFLLLHFIHVPALMGKVFIIQSAMPAMTNTSIVAKGYGADYKLASIATVITTLLSIIVIPLLMIII